LDGETDGVVLLK